MKKVLLAAVAAIGLASSANAVTITLESTSGDGFGNTVFTYQGTLTEDEGVRSGDKLIIYDFAGYVVGSIFTPGADVVGSVELTSDLPLLPGRVDDPTLLNLVFTYIGAPFRNTGGPFEGGFDFDNFGASSIFSNTTLEDFSALTTKNNPEAEENTGVLSIGRVQTPLSPIPEPATWAMLIGGFGMIGAAMRGRRQRMVSVTA